ncbi:MAG: hypothetical protein HY561_11210, partial [Gemmatimonadetes bacterium]|nr:hypothetical protein [Gemmatimonadota bacterium]
DQTSPFLVRDQNGTGTSFRLYRVPLRGSGFEAVNFANDGTWRYMKHLRMTIAGTPQAQDTLILARMRIVGSRWTKRATHGILRGLAGESEGSAAGFKVGPVSRLTDGGAYSSPPGVGDQLQDPTASFGTGGVVFNEKSVRLSYEGLAPGDRAETYFRYPQQPRNFLSYRSLRLWIVPRAGNWGPQGDQRLLVKVGTDAKNFYLYQTRLRPAADGAGVREEDWLPEAGLDFERWFELKAKAEQRFITEGKPANGLLEEWSEDSTYAVVLEDRARAPNLAAVRELSFAVYNAGGTPATGEVWIDDLRLGAALTDAGFAGELNLDVRAAGFLTASVGYASRGALFRQLNQEADYQRTGDLRLSGTVQLGQFAPTAWGLELPVTVSHTRTGLEPSFLQQSDVRADQLEGLRETGSEATRVSLSLRKATPTPNRWLSLLVDGAALRVGYSTASSTAITSRSEAEGLDGTLSYGRQLEARTFDVTPGFLETVLRWIIPKPLEETELFRRVTGARLRWSPESLSLASTYFHQDSRAFRYEKILAVPGDSAVRATESPREGLENQARVGFRPFQSLQADLSVSSSRNLLEPERATLQARERQAISGARAELAGIDIGWETNRSMNAQVSFRPELSSWLRPGFTYSAQFSTERTPSYYELTVQDGDTMAVMQRGFQSGRQTSRSVLLEPAGLLQATLGRPTSWLERTVLRLGGRLLPIDLGWTAAVNSKFERETFAPPFGYQLGLGGFGDFRLIGRDTAVNALERSDFRARSGVRLPLKTELQLAYTRAESRAIDLRGGQRNENQRGWPDLRFTWNDIPVPATLRPVIGRATITAGYQHRSGISVFGEAGAFERICGEAGAGVERRQCRGNEETSIPLGLNLSLGQGISAAYTGSFTSGTSNDNTGAAENGGRSHAVQLVGSFMVPGGLAQTLPQPIQASLRYGYTSQFQCRERNTAAADCTPFTDVLSRSFHLTLDTVLSQLNLGLQMSYTDRQSFVGTRTGSSQFQLGLFGQFNFATGMLPGGGR